MELEEFIKDFSLSKFDIITVKAKEKELYLKKTKLQKPAIIVENKVTNEVSNKNNILSAKRVGLFYLKVAVGDLIDEQTVIGQIKAMNIMHEIKSHKVGKVRRILIDDGDAVEYGDELLELEGQE